MAMKVGLLFHHDPFRRPPGIDLVRLRGMATGLRRLGVNAEIIAPVRGEAEWPVPGGKSLTVRPVEVLLDGGETYDLVKTCYHPSIKLLGRFRGPVVSRLVRVVDEELPRRDRAQRRRMLADQELISRRATVVAFNNRHNLLRWRERYGRSLPAVLTPTGVAETLPSAGSNPYTDGEAAILFLGSVATAKMARLLNLAAEKLAGRARIHLVGRNKTGLYGGRIELSGLIRDHGEVDEPRVWDFIRWARVGLSLAAGPDEFDNDSSKVYAYLRGGLRVLVEQRVVQTDLVTGLGMGGVCSFDDPDDLVKQAVQLAGQPEPANRDAVMALMVREHSWLCRAEIYADLFRRLVDRSRTHRRRS
jgi:hypothetical protein